MAQAEGTGYFVSSGEYIYKRLYDYYNGQQLPDDSTGVFFSTPNFNRKRLIECIEFLQKNYGAGWLTGDEAKDKSVLNTLANDLYVRFDGSIDFSKIYKFLCWVYAFAKKDTTAKKYFKYGLEYGAGSYYTDKIANTVSNSVSSAVDTVKYGLSVPTITSDSFTKGLDNIRTVLKLLPIAAVAGLIGWALLNEKN